MGYISRLALRVSPWARDASSIIWKYLLSWVLLVFILLFSVLVVCNSWPSEAEYSFAWPTRGYLVWNGYERIRQLAKISTLPSILEYPTAKAPRVFDTVIVMVKFCGSKSSGTNNSLIRPWSITVSLLELSIVTMQPRIPLLHNRVAPKLALSHRFDHLAILLEENQ